MRQGVFSKGQPVNQPYNLISKEILCNEVQNLYRLLHIQVQSEQQNSRTVQYSTIGRIVQSYTYKVSTSKQSGPPDKHLYKNVTGWQVQYLISSHFYIQLVQSTSSSWSRVETAETSPQHHRNNPTSGMGWIGRPDTVSNNKQDESSTQHSPCAYEVCSQ
jgi:hypothetical protein